MAPLCSRVVRAGDLDLVVLRFSLSPFGPIVLSFLAVRVILHSSWPPFASSALVAPASAGNRQRFVASNGVRPGNGS